MPWLVESNLVRERGRAGWSARLPHAALEERGLVRRVAGADDQRTVVGELTQKGRALIADVFPDHAEQLRRLMSGLLVADKYAAATLPRRLTTGASAHQ